MPTIHPGHRPLPYYRWYPSDYRLSRHAQRLTYIERGLYRELLDECWLEGCIPDDLAQLADICNCPIGVMRRAWAKLKELFEPITGMDGILLKNRRLELERTIQDRRRAQTKAAGALGGKAKQTLASAKHPSYRKGKERRGEDTENPQFSTREQLNPAHHALLTLRQAVWTAGQDGRRDLNWQTVPAAIRARCRVAWLASGWSVEEFDQGKDFGNSKRFCAAYNTEIP